MWTGRGARGRCRRGNRVDPRGHARRAAAWSGFPGAWHSPRGSRPAATRDDLPSPSVMSPPSGEGEGPLGATVAASQTLASHGGSRLYTWTAHAHAVQHAVELQMQNVDHSRGRGGARRQCCCELMRLVCVCVHSTLLARTQLTGRVCGDLCGVGCGLGVRRTGSRTRATRPRPGRVAAYRLAAYRLALRTRSVDVFINSNEALCLKLSCGRYIRAIVPRWLRVHTKKAVGHVAHVEEQAP